MKKKGFYKYNYSFNLNIFIKSDVFLIFNFNIAERITKIPLVIISLHIN